MERNVHNCRIYSVGPVEDRGKNNRVFRKTKRKVPATTFGNIQDGSSNTILIGERASRTEEASGAVASERVDAYGAIWAGRIRNSRRNERGHFSNDTCVGRLTTGDDSRSWGVNGPRTSDGLISRFHPGGGHATFGGGSTPFLSDNTTLDALKNLAAMSDGQVVQIDF